MKRCISLAVAGLSGEKPADVRAWTAIERADSRSAADLAPRELAFPKKRMKGLEPSTFCMASRRSSQLSYIRGRRQV
jgi:hypothetical protein